jgi:RNA polymerase sigma-70 factor, ECF subfamily
MLALPIKRSVPPPVLRDEAAAAFAKAPVSEPPPAPSLMPASAVDGERIRQAFDRHLNCVWRVMRRLGVPQAGVDDAVQRVFIVLARRIAEVEPGSERAFLLGTAARVASEIRRSPAQRRETSGELQLDHEIDPQPLPDEIMERRRAGALLDSILRTMPESLSEAFVLYEFESLTVPEIAELMQIPVGTAASRLRRARAHFQERVAKLEATRGRRGVET